MRGLMMDFPLTLHHVFWRVERLFPEKEIVTRTPEGIDRYTYGDFALRVRRLAGALSSLGVGPGDRVATFAANTHRHLELYFAVPLAGAVLHTLNVRFTPDQLAWVAAHAGDRVLFAEASLARLVEPVLPRLRTVRTVVRVGEGGWPGPPALDYEDLLAAADPVGEWPSVDEDAAAGLCYTSGTTGQPKGVLYSHRSTLLHALGISSGSAFGYREDDVVLTVVPMYHAMAWGQPYAAALAGAAQVLPGAFPSPATLLSLIESQRVTVTAGVPTVWAGLLDELARRPADVSSLRLLAVGGAAVSPALVRALRERGIPVVPSWGMTEISPVGTLGHVKAALRGSPREVELLTRAGLPIPGVEVRIVGESGEELPWDAEAAGELEVRGPWVASAPLGEEPSGAWLPTGDVARIDPSGYIRIVDRSRDLVKSGGEWIPSAELERALMSHPGVAEAAVVAVPHPRWGERPLACVALRPGAAVAAGELLDHLRGRFPDWWLPEDVVFVDEVPKTSVGKFDKRALRERFAPARPHE